MTNWPTVGASFSSPSNKRSDVAFMNDLGNERQSVGASFSSPGNKRSDVARMIDGKARESMHSYAHDVHLNAT